MQSALLSFGLTLLHSWQRLQVTYYGGKYSIQRALALEAYTTSASVSRVLFVCVGSLLPMLSLVFALELIPLQDPKEGWRSNYGFWIRSSVMVYVGAHALTVQATYLIDGINISVCRQILLSIGASVGAAACSMAVASQFGFPVPFFVLTMTPVFCGAHLVAFRAVVGSRMFRQILAQRDQLIDYSNFVSPQFMVAFIYPAYEALFRFAEGSRLQLAVILMLPFLKMIVKYIMLRCTKHMEDMTPEAVIFTVDFFNALYIATCMQSAHSVAAVTIMTITDLLQTTLMLYGLHRRTVTSQDRLRLIIPTRTSTVSESDNLLTALCLLYRNPDNIKRLSRSGVRVRSCLPHRLSASDRSSLNAIVEHEDSFRVLHSSTVAAISPSQNGVNNTKTREKTQISRLVTPLCCRSRSTIYPLETSSRKTKADSSWEETRPAECPTTQPINRAIILRETLEILFTTECLVLTAYLEAVIPLFYSSYVLAMVNLSNALYHTELAGITYENVGTTVLPVFVFGLLQIISFVLLTSLIKRNCGLRSFHLLAFVLETQMPLIQGKLMFWAGLTLCFRVVHFGKHIYFTDWLSTAVGINVDKLFPFDYAGVDFTFKFSEE